MRAYLRGEDTFVNDALYIFLTCAFFAASAGIVFALERLHTGPKP
jgi:hypothetical protein